MASHETPPRSPPSPGANLLRFLTSWRTAYYGWRIVLAGAASNFVILGITVFTFGVFITPMREELGWSVAAISVGFSIRTAEMGFLSPLSGLSIDRFGPRKTAIFGVLMVALGLALFSQVHTLWLFYLSSVVIAVGQSFGAMNPFSAAIMNWFSKARGRAVGVLNTGNGIGSFMVPVMAAMIVAVGWRPTLAITAAFVLIAGLPLALVIKNRPQEMGLLPDGERATTEDPPEAADLERQRRTSAAGEGLSVGQTMRVPGFYLLGLASAVGGGTQVAWVVHQVPHLEDRGFSLAMVGIIVAAYAAIQVPARIGLGWLGDAIGRKRLYTVSFLFQGIGMFFAANAAPGESWALAGFFLAYPVGHAAWVVTFQTIIADYFGTRRFASIRGLMTMFHMPLGVATPIIAGWMFDATDSYRLIFMAYAALAASGAVWASLARRPVLPGPPASAR